MCSKKLNIYADKQFLPDDERHVVMLYPFWGGIPELAGDIDSGRFDVYASSGNHGLILVPQIDEADIILLPFEWRSWRQWGSKFASRVQLANALADMAAIHDKQVMVLFNNDSDEEIPVRNALVLRTSLFRTFRRTNEYALPAWSVDFLQSYRHGKSEIRQKVTVPSVGYCGYVDYLHYGLREFASFAKRLAQGRINLPGSRLRGKAIRTLIKDSRLQVNLIIRDRFNGGCAADLRQEYADNLLESDYALVVRGAGNFSYRLYEVLSCGRIPVFIDTDCVLPYDEQLDWPAICVWVDQADLDNIAERILEFHNNMTNDEFIELQIKLRTTYEQWISPLGFFNNLWRYVTVSSPLKKM